MLWNAASHAARLGAGSGGCSLAVQDGKGVWWGLDGVRQLPTLTALLSVVRLYLQINIYLFPGLELFFRQPDSVLKGPLR